MSHAQPQLWVFAGPNGAGKSTLIRRQKFADWMPVVNADDIAAGLRQEHVGMNEAAIIAKAGRMALAQRNALNRRAVIRYRNDADWPQRASSDAGGEGARVQGQFGLRKDCQPPTIQ